MATADKMLKDIQRRGLRLPEWGSGKNGKILNSDLERVLANSYFNELYVDSEGFPTSDWGLRRRLDLDEVMLAYRYSDLDSAMQQHVMQDNNEWVAEEKYNGCRMVITYHPDEGFRAYGRNRSKLTYLPIDYSKKILVNGKRLCEVEYRSKAAVILDCELLTSGFVETKDGNFTRNQLNAAVAALQLNEAESHLAQNTTAHLYCKVFDCLKIDGISGQPEYAHTFAVRSANATAFVTSFASSGHTSRYAGFFQRSEQALVGKQAFLNGLLAEGKEGLILKNVLAPYVRGINGFRDRTACIKVKRTMQGTLGDEIDAYVIGYTNGTEWDKKGLIAGLKLAVLLRGEDGELQEHWIATVSGIPDEMRSQISDDSIGPNMELEEPHLKREFYGKVLTIDGMDISARNRRISHAKVDWERGFRTDKDASQCIMDEKFIDSQMF